MKPSSIPNICIYTARDFPYGTAAENFVRMMALGLHENGARVEVIRFRGRLKRALNDTPVKCCNYLFPTRAGNDFIKLFELIALVLFIPFSLLWRRFYRKDHVVVLYGLEYFYFVSPFILFCKLYRLKCVRIITDYYKPGMIAPKWWKKPKVYFYHLQFRKFDRYLDGILVLSSFMYNKCLENKVKENRLIHILHFIDVGTEDDIMNLPPPEGKIIGFCGNPSIENGILELAEAFEMVLKEIPDAELRIIGQVESAVREKLMTIIKNKDRLTLTGYIPHQEVKKQLQACAVLVNPRRNSEWAISGFPTKLGEYLASGRQVITSGYPMEFNTEFRNIIINILDNNAKTLKQSLIQYFKNSEFLNTVNENGYRWAVKYLDYNSNSRILLGFLVNNLRK